MTPPQLIAHLRELGYAVTVTPTGPQLVPTVKGAIMPKATLERVKAHRAELVAWLTACRQCGRDCGTEEDRQRLRTVNPFCTEVGCPWREKLT